MRISTVVQGDGSLIPQLRYPGANLIPQSGALPVNRAPRGLRGLGLNPPQESVDAEVIAREPGPEDLEIPTYRVDVVERAPDDYAWVGWLLLAGAVALGVSEFSKGGKRHG